MTEAKNPEQARRQRMRAGLVSLVAGALIFGGKVAAYVVTGSAAVFSDAMESIVNVAAAALLVWSLAVAARPPDRDHPYGHGKVEFFSAGFEGLLILVAAVMIAIQALRQLVSGEGPAQLTLGLVLLMTMGAANAALGLYLLRIGRRTGSLALTADARHVLADVWTSVGVVLGLLAVKFTGLTVLDPLIALAVAAWICREGAGLLRESVRGLMDEADDALLAELAGDLDAQRPDAWIDVHGLRAWRSGAELHVDFHLVVPRYFDAERLHGIHETLERCLLGPPRGATGDVVVHFDPCDNSHCAQCTVDACPVRARPAVGARPPIDLARATRGDPDTPHAAGARHYSGG